MDSVFFAIIYTKIVIIMTGVAALHLYYLAYRLDQNPPELFIDARGQGIIFSTHLYENSILWVRIIAALYLVMCFFAVCSLYTLPENMKPENACYAVGWLTINAFIDILAVTTIILSYYQDFDWIWILVPLPFLILGILAWIIFDLAYNDMKDSVIKLMNIQDHVKENFL